MTQNDKLIIRITSKLLHNYQRTSPEKVIFPGAGKNPWLNTSLFQVDAVKCLVPAAVYSMTQTAWKHLIQEGWPKQKEV